MNTQGPTGMTGRRGDPGKPGIVGKPVNFVNYLLPKDLLFLAKPI